LVWRTKVAARPFRPISPIRMSVVVATDFSEPAKHASDLGAAIARKKGDRLFLVHGFEIPALLDPQAHRAWEDLRKTSREALENEARRLADYAGIAVQPVFESDPAEELVRETVARTGAGVVLAGTTGARGVTRYLLGSTAERIIRTSPAPVLTVPGPARGLLEWANGSRPLRATVGSDLEKGLGKIVEFARWLCGSAKCELDIVHVFDLPWPPRSPMETLDLVNELRTRSEAALLHEARHLAAAESPSIPIERVFVLQGKPAESIARFAASRDADLILVGTHRRTGLERVIVGSVATGVLRHATMPVAITPI
jgi:nucleotide-binding universal stress UspA family protein